MPAVVMDWKAIKKSRPEDRKKVDQKTRKFLPLTDAVIEGHLLGKETIGVYALLPDETCWFLAADFDKTTWEYEGAQDQWTLPLLADGRSDRSKGRCQRPFR
jgi:hypothetical protein